jgi:hypothetical protein
VALAVVVVAYVRVVVVAYLLAATRLCVGHGASVWLVYGLAGV